MKNGLRTFVPLTGIIRVIGWFCGVLFVFALIVDLAQVAAHWIVERL